MAPLAHYWKDAQVIWWDSKNISVKCPYCDKGEVHPSTNLPYLRDGRGSPQMQQSSCHTELGLMYYLIFPRDNWEIDVERKRYITADMKQPEEAEQLDIAEMEEQDDTISWAAGGFGEVRDLKGNTSLCIAAREGNIKSMTALLEKGYDINATNHIGWGPVHHAAFNGKVNAVLQLLKHGVRRDLRDHQDRTASDLARILDDEYKRRGAVLDENMLRRQEYLRIIATLLQPSDLSSPREEQPIYRANSAIATHRSPSLTSIARYPRGYLTILAPVASWNVHNVKQKTTGILLRGPEHGSTFPHIYALSGWDNRSKGSLELLDNTFWTEEVCKVAASLGHPLIETTMDYRGRPGLGVACHVEKQLAVAFVRRHRFDETQLQDPIMKRLKRIQLPWSLNKATILIDRDPCECCLSFIEKVKRKFGVEIKIKKMDQIIAPRPYDTIVKNRKSPSKKSSDVQGLGIMTPNRSPSKYWDDDFAPHPQSRKRNRDQITSLIETDDSDSSYGSPLHKKRKRSNRDKATQMSVTSGTSNIDVSEIENDTFLT